MIETSQLQVLMAVEASDNLSMAADSLNITQSAVSQNLKSIEQKVGFEVVVRQGKKVVLTPGGKKLAKLGKSYLKKFDDTLNEILQSQNKVIGSIALGTMFGIGKSWVAHRMLEFSAMFPDLQVKVIMDFPDKVLGQFENHDLDCLIMPDALTPHYSEHQFLHDEKSTLVFPDSEKFNITTETTLKEILDYPIIFFEDKDTLFYTWCKEKFGTVPRNVRPRLVVNAFGQMLQAVHDGLGIAVIPTHVFRRSYFKDKVKTLGKKFDIESSTFNFVYHSEDKESLKMQTLYEFLQKEVENLDF